MSVPPTVDESTDGAAPTGRRRRRAVIAALAVLVVAALVVLGAVITGDDDGTATPDGTSSSAAESVPTDGSADGTAGAEPSEPTAAAPEEAPTPSTGANPATPPADSAELPPALPVVSLDEPVVVDGLTASLSLIEAIEGRATGPGDVAGPAVRVTVRIDNPTDGELSLDGVSVNLFHGPDRTPASPLADPSRSPFGGTLPSGDAAEGVYVFSVPTDARSDVTVEVGYRAGAQLAAFTGAVS
ncbi:MULTISPECIES: hypothetical protein [unclassified Modestobacter]